MSDSDETVDNTSEKEENEDEEQSSPSILANWHHTNIVQSKESSSAKKTENDITVENNEDSQTAVSPEFPLTCPGLKRKGYSNDVLLFNSSGNSKILRMETTESIEGQRDTEDKDHESQKVTALLSNLETAITELEAKTIVDRNNHSARAVLENIKSQLTSVQRTLVKVNQRNKVERMKVVTLPGTCQRLSEEKKEVILRLADKQRNVLEIFKKYKSLVERLKLVKKQEAPKSDPQNRTMTGSCYMMPSSQSSMVRTSNDTRMLNFQGVTSGQDVNCFNCVIFDDHDTHAATQSDHLTTDQSTLPQCSTLATKIPIQQPGNASLVVSNSEATSVVTSAKTPTVTTQLAITSSRAPATNAMTPQSAKNISMNKTKDLVSSTSSGVIAINQPAQTCNLGRAASSAVKDNHPTQEKSRMTGNTVLSESAGIRKVIPPTITSSKSNTEPERNTASSTFPVCANKIGSIRRDGQCTLTTNTSRSVGATTKVFTNAAVALTTNNASVTRHAAPFTIIQHGACSTTTTFKTNTINSTTKTTRSASTNNLCATIPTVSGQVLVTNHPNTNKIDTPLTIGVPATHHGQGLPLCKHTEAPKSIPGTGFSQSTKQVSSPPVSLETLVKKGVLASGRNVLKATSEGKVYTASLSEKGTIISAGGEGFTSPRSWVKAILGSRRKVKNDVAWKMVSYKDKSLLDYANATRMEAQKQVNDRSFSLVSTSMGAINTNGNLENQPQLINSGAALSRLLNNCRIAGVTEEEFISSDKIFGKNFWERTDWFESLSNDILCGLEF